jgi:hypothetical protein
MMDLLLLSPSLAILPVSRLGRNVLDDIGQGFSHGCTTILPLSELQEEPIPSTMRSLGRDRDAEEMRAAVCELGLDYEWAPNGCLPLERKGSIDDAPHASPRPKVPECDGERSSSRVIVMAAK